MGPKFGPKFGPPVWAQNLGKSLIPDLGILARKKRYLLAGGQILLPDALVLIRVYILGVCGPGYGGPWPWGLGICRKPTPPKVGPGPSSSSKKIENPSSWICHLDDKQNGFGLSEAPPESSVDQIRGVRINFSPRTQRCACRPLGTNFSRLSTPDILGPGPSGAQGGAALYSY